MSLTDTTARAEQLPQPAGDVSPATLRVLLKQNLGYSARQVTVAMNGSTGYIRITVRDPAVDVNKVKAFAASFHTWKMGMDDYVSGQSVRVTTTGEVDTAHAAPYLAEIRKVLAGYKDSEGAILSTGAALCASSQGFYVCKGDARGQYVSDYDAREGRDSAVHALAVSVARLEVDRPALDQVPTPASPVAHAVDETPAAMAGQLPTYRLRFGTEVLACMEDGDLVPCCFADEAQAKARLVECGAGWRLYQSQFVRGIYISRIARSQPAILFTTPQTPMNSDLSLNVAGAALLVVDAGVRFWEDAVVNGAADTTGTL